MSADTPAVPSPTAITRTALVTGGASGIGRATCIALAAAGRRVAVSDINSEAAAETAEVITEAGGTAIAVTMDITNADSVTNGCLEAIDRLGEIDVLVNVAGWDRFMKFVDTDEDFWDQIIDINFKGMMRTTHFCVPRMIDNGWGRIINVASDAGRVGSSLEAVYSGAKGGTIAFSKTLAREVARKGVTVNVVCPGPTDTPLLSSIVGDGDGDNSERVITAMAGAVAMKRLGTAEEVAPAIVYFASDGAGFTTGQTLSVSGGLTMA